VVFYVIFSHLRRFLLLRISRDHKSNGLCIMWSTLRDKRRHTRGELVIAYSLFIHLFSFLPLRDPSREQGVSIPNLDFGLQGA